MSAPLPRTVRGKRPGFYEGPVMDQAMSMIMVLAQELSVMHDRVDTVERVAAAKGVMLETDIEGYVPDQKALESRELWRQGLLDRLFYLMRQEAAEASAGDDADRYQKSLDEIGEG